jgi:hypothetical protein
MAKNDISFKDIKIENNLFDNAVDNFPVEDFTGGFFKSLAFSKRDEIILPYSHRLDEKSLRNALKDYYKDFRTSIVGDEKLHQVITSWLKRKPIKEMDGNPYGTNKDAVCQLVSDEYKAGTIPGHLVNDLFTLFYNPMDRLSFEDRLPDNLAKFKMIEKMNSPVLKVITFHNPLKTMVINRGMITHILLTIVFGKYGSDPDDAQDMKDLIDMLSKKQNPMQVPSGQPCDAQQNAGQANQGNIPMPSGRQKGKGQQQQPQPGQQSNGQHPDGDPQADHHNQSSKPIVQNQDVADDFNGQNQPGQDPAQQQPGAPAQDDPNAPQSNNQQTPGQQPQAGTDPAAQQNSSAPANSQGQPQAGTDPNVQQLDDDDSDQWDDEYNDDQNQGSGFGNTDIASLDKQLNDVMKRMYSDKAAKAAYDKIMDSARDTAESMESLMDDEEMLDTWHDMSDEYSDDIDDDDDQRSEDQKKKDALLKTNPGKLKALEKELQKIGIDMGALKSQIKRLLDKSVSFFSAKQILKFENIMETDDIGGLMDYELLHPAIRNMFLEDIMVRDTKKVGKIACYVDVSASMNMGSGAYDSNGDTITRATLAKAITLQLKKMNLLSKLFTFESYVHPTGNETMHVLTMSGGGGTDLDNVVKHINKTGCNSLIITDADDTVNQYSDKAYFIGIKGANFGQFSASVRKQYLANDQLIIFDGQEIQKVGKDGRAIEKAAWRNAA